MSSPQNIAAPLLHLISPAQTPHASVFIIISSSPQTGVGYAFSNTYAKNDGSEYKDFVVGKSEWNEKKASAKFKAVSAKIKELNADIIALTLSPSGTYTPTI